MKPKRFVRNQVFDYQCVNCRQVMTLNKRMGGNTQRKCRSCGSSDLWRTDVLLNNVLGVKS